MKKVDFLSVTGSMWHYHMIGMGLIYTYNLESKKLWVTCSHTGQVVSISDCDGCWDSVQEFKESIQSHHLQMIETDVPPLDLEYMEDPTIIGCIGVDLQLMRN